MRSADELCTVVRSTVRRFTRTSALAAPPYTAVIEEATRCLEDLDRAVAFRDADGLVRLDDAIEAAERAGDAELAARGRSAASRLRKNVPEENR